jgi:hypothetical protein
MAGWCVLLCVVRAFFVSSCHSLAGLPQDPDADLDIEDIVRTSEDIARRWLPDDFPDTRFVGWTDCDEMRRSALVNVWENMAGLARRSITRTRPWKGYMKPYGRRISIP